MFIGYMRVSKSDGSQTLDLQRDALLAAGVEPACLYEDYASGRQDSRPGLQACLKALQPGNTLVVWKLDRLGRSLRDLISLLDVLKTQGVAFRSLTESIDTATSTGRAMWQMVGILAELERSLIQERTKAGRAAAKARGVKMGPKFKLTLQQIAHARQLIEQGEHHNTVARLLRVSRRTLYRALATSQAA